MCHFSNTKSDARSALPNMASPSDNLVVCLVLHYLLKDHFLSFLAVMVNAIPSPVKTHSWPGKALFCRHCSASEIATLLLLHFLLCGSNHTHSKLSLWSNHRILPQHNSLIITDTEKEKLSQTAKKSPLGVLLSGFSSDEGKGTFTVHGLHQ